MQQRLALSAEVICLQCHTTQRPALRARFRAETRRPKAMNRPKYSLIATLAAVLAVTFFCPTAKAYLYNLTPGGGGSYSIAATPVYVTLNKPRTEENTAE